MIFDFSEKYYISSYAHVPITFTNFTFNFAMIMMSKIIHIQTFRKIIYKIFMVDLNILSEGKANKI